MLNLVDISKEEHDKIEMIFVNDDCRVWNSEDVGEDKDYGYGYFIVGLRDDEVDDVFYDHTEAFDKIFKELQCVCTGFQFNNDYYEKGQVNTHYGIWFNKLKNEEIVN